MENQQPSPEQGKVQRLSRQRVQPSGWKWATPFGDDIVYAHRKL